MAIVNPETAEVSAVTDVPIVESVNTAPKVQIATENEPANVVLEKPKSDSDIYFKVQISASSESIPKNSEFFKSIDNVEELKTENGFKYLVGNCHTYAEIVEYSKMVRVKFPDAFIIAFKNGEIIPLIKAIQESKN